MKLLPPALITCHVETRNFIMTREVPTGNRHLLKVDKNERKKAAVSPDQPKSSTQKPQDVLVVATS
jgi:hypothetical protein